MKLYLFLRTRIPNSLAIILAALWLALLIVLAVVFSFEPAGEFRYGNI
jgi:hypothetical protein